MSRGRKPPLPMKKAKTKFAVLVRGSWFRTVREEETMGGFLEYELAKGETGLAKPGEWKPVDQVKAQGFEVKQG